MATIQCLFLVHFSDLSHSSNYPSQKLNTALQHPKMNTLVSATCDITPEASSPSPLILFRIAD